MGAERMEISAKWARMAHQVIQSLLFSVDLNVLSNKILERSLHMNKYGSIPSLAHPHTFSSSSYYYYIFQKDCCHSTIIMITFHMLILTVETWLLRMGPCLGLGQLSQLSCVNMALFTSKQSWKLKMMIHIPLVYFASEQSVSKDQSWHWSSVWMP